LRTHQRRNPSGRIAFGGRGHEGGLEDSSVGAEALAGFCFPVGIFDQPIARLQVVQQSFHQKLTSALSPDAHEAALLWGWRCCAKGTIRLYRLLNPTHRAAGGRPRSAVTRLPRQAPQPLRRRFTDSRG
jgi:hypothetical protein